MYEKRSDTRGKVNTSSSRQHQISKARDFVPHRDHHDVLSRPNKPKSVSIQTSSYVLGAKKRGNSILGTTTTPTTEQCLLELSKPCKVHNHLRCNCRTVSTKQGATVDLIAGTGQNKLANIEQSSDHVSENHDSYGLGVTENSENDCENTASSLSSRLKAPKSSLQHIRAKIARKRCSSPNAIENSKKV